MFTIPRSFFFCGFSGQLLGLFLDFFIHWSLITCVLYWRPASWLINLSIEVKFSHWYCWVDSFTEACIRIGLKKGIIPRFWEQIKSDVFPVGGGSKRWGKAAPLRWDDRHIGSLSERTGGLNKSTLWLPFFGSSSLGRLQVPHSLPSLGARSADGVVQSSAISAAHCGLQPRLPLH